MSECICKGNWRAIVKESEPFLDKFFNDDKGATHRFVGVMHSADDYYYCMLSGAGAVQRLSCVGSLEMHGFELMDS